MSNMIKADDLTKLSALALARMAGEGILGVYSILDISTLKQHTDSHVQAWAVESFRRCSDIRSYLTAITEELEKLEIREQRKRVLENMLRPTLRE